MVDERDVARVCLGRASPEYLSFTGSVLSSRARPIAHAPWHIAHNRMDDEYEASPPSSPPIRMERLHGSVLERLIYQAKGKYELNFDKPCVSRLDTSLKTTMDIPTAGKATFNEHLRGSAASVRVPSSAVELSPPATSCQQLRQPTPQLSTATSFGRLKREFYGDLSHRGYANPNPEDGPEPPYFSPRAGTPQLGRRAAASAGADGGGWEAEAASRATTVPGGRRHREGETVRAREFWRYTRHRAATSSATHHPVLDEAPDGAQPAQPAAGVHSGLGFSRGYRPLAPTVLIPSLGATASQLRDAWSRVRRQTPLAVP